MTAVLPSPEDSLHLHSLVTFIKNFLLAEPMESRRPGTFQLISSLPFNRGTKGEGGAIAAAAAATGGFIGEIGTTGFSTLVPPCERVGVVLRDPESRIEGVNAGLMGNFWSLWLMASRVADDLMRLGLGAVVQEVRWV